MVRETISLRIDNEVIKQVREKLSPVGGSLSIIVENFFKEWLKNEERRKKT